MSLRDITRYPGETDAELRDRIFPEKKATRGLKKVLLALGIKSARSLPGGINVSFAGVVIRIPGVY